MLRIRTLVGSLSLGNHDRLPFAALLVALALSATATFAADASAPADRGQADAATVEMFSAIDQGQIEVKFIAANAKRGNVFIKNRTGQALNVKLPEAFAGVPVLGQAGGAAGGGAARRAAGGGGGSSVNQSMGGGMGGMGGGGMNLGGGRNMMGGGFFNVAPEKEVRFTVPLVCLDHGKKDPTPHVAYKLVPFDQFSQDGALKHLLAELGRGKLDREAAQAAAWHLRSDLPWSFLAEKTVRHLNGVYSPYFTQQQMQLATQYVATAQEAAGRAKETTGVNTESTGATVKSPGKIAEEAKP